MKQDVNKPKVVVAIPTLNNLKYLKWLLGTISLSEPYFIMVIDNGSTDGTREFLRKQNKPANFVYCEADFNVGCSGSWNIAAATAFVTLECDRLICLNNDILLKAETLDVMLETLKGAKIGLTTGVDVASKVASSEEFYARSKPEFNSFVEEPQFSCFAIDKKTFEKVGPFDEGFYPAYFEDNDYHYRMKQADIRAVCCYGAEYYHFGSRTKALSVEFTNYIAQRHVKNEQYYIEKWGGKPGEEKYIRPFNDKKPSKKRTSNYSADVERIIKVMNYN